jgi:hypothetical protein
MEFTGELKTPWIEALERLPTRHDRSAQGEKADGALAEKFEEAIGFTKAA